VERLEELIASFADNEPAFWSLGTPVIGDTASTDAVVRMGVRAVPALRAALRNGNPKIVVYAAYSLGRIGDADSLPLLHRVLEEFDSKSQKSSYDFAAIEVISQATKRLGAGGG
jgi:HEAT repeat protein